MIASAPNGIDAILIVAAVIIAIATVFISARELQRWEDEREARYWERRNRAAAQLEEVPADWIEELDAIRRMPEVAS